MKKALIIAYYLDLRTKKFVDYLPYFGFEPILIVARIPLIDINQNIATKNGNGNHNRVVHRTLNVLPLEYVTFPFFLLGTNYRLLFLPDMFFTWIPQTFVRALGIIRKKKVDLIYISGPPFSPMIIGWLLKRQTGTPLILDLRDFWTILQDSRMRYPTKLHERIDTRIERAMFREADHIVANTETMRREYVKKCPDLESKLSVIPNGFDIVDFPTDKPTFSKFTVTYTGSLYGSGERPIGLFFDALLNVVNRGSIPKKDVQVFLIGAKTKQLDQDIKLKRLQEIVKSTGRMPQKQALKYVLASSLLLVIELTNSIPAKTYEYLAAAHPILAIVSQGEHEQLIRTYSQVSYVITSGSVKEIEDSIVDAYSKWVKNEIRENATNQYYFRRQYNRKKLTEDLARVFDTALARQMD